MGTSKKQKKRDGLRYREFVLSPYGVIKIKSLGYTFEPTLFGKNEKQLNGFDDRIISLYSRGLSTRDIQAHFKEVYGVDVSAGFISQVTNAVMDDVKRWQQRPLDALYPIVYLDCIVVKSQDGGAVANKSVYLALGVNGQGEKELLGLWIAKTEGAKFWL